MRMEYLPDSWNKLVDVFLSTSVFVFLDYDGTLTPIVDKPENAVLSAESMRVLRRLRDKYCVGIVSGRSLEDVRSLVGVSGIYYAGNHGLEVSGPKINSKALGFERFRPVIREICSNLKSSLGDVDGVLVEDKGLTASIHYRLVSERDRGRVEGDFWNLVGGYVDSGDVKVTSGKMVFEIRPSVDWDKGRAVKWVVDSAGGGDSLIVYFGDDRTDEDVFRRLGEGDVGVLVSEDEGIESGAGYFLRDVDEVIEFLSVLSRLE
ncbi:MAG: trehalose-phosphatase [Candidatus Altiarchaeales archaeon ex4484_2]|nr:MAG: trehalose-phosphatase [Candidatus Altiarchaeales archaeon ex4484_2]